MRVPRRRVAVHRSSTISDREARRASRRAHWSCRYGADAAQFLGRIRERLENPLGLILSALARHAERDRLVVEQLPDIAAGVAWEPLERPTEGGFPGADLEAGVVHAVVLV